MTFENTNPQAQELKRSPEIGKTYKLLVPFAYRATPEENSMFVNLPAGKSVIIRGIVGSSDPNTLSVTIEIDGIEIYMPFAYQALAQILV